MPVRVPSADAIRHGTADEHGLISASLGTDVDACKSYLVYRAAWMDTAVADVSRQYRTGFVHQRWPQVTPEFLSQLLEYQAAGAEVAFGDSQNAPMTPDAWYLPSRPAQ